MKINPYLCFKGDCEAAFKFYEQCLNGKLGGIFRYGGSPMEDRAPAGWSDKVMHGSVIIDDQVLFGADVAPEQYEPPKGFTLSLGIDSIAEAERVFREMTKEGSVVVPLEKTFWATRFAQFFDRFGIPWMINCDGPEGS